MTQAVVVFAPGFEELEGVAIVDVLRRAGIDVFVAGMRDAGVVTGAHDIRIQVDGSLSQIPTDYDAVILPGGMPGAENLATDDDVLNLLRCAAANGCLVAAVCAAPIALAAAGLLEGKKITCYPGFESRLTGAVVTGERVQIDGRLITGQGPGAAIEFALAIATELGHAEAAEKLQTGMLLAIP